jgi:hypothetical protein
MPQPYHSDSPVNPYNLPPETFGGDWQLPKDPEDIEGMIRLQLRVFRETNAFPTDTPLTREQMLAIVQELPPLGTPNYLEDRLAIFARGHMKSLDLARTYNQGDWEVGDELDEKVMNYLHGFVDNPELQRSMGLTAIGGIIARGDERAEPHSHATILGEELERQGIFLVTRQRLVGWFALRSNGLTAVVRKRSNFALHGNDAPTDELLVRASAIAHGGVNPQFAMERNLTDQLEEMNRDLRVGFNAAVERAIADKADYMKPFSMGYHIATKSRPQAKK